MAKTKEELNTIKKELTSFTIKLQELDDEEIEAIVGGDKTDIDFDLIPAPGSRSDITKRIFGGTLRSVFTDTPTTSTFTGDNTEESINEYAIKETDKSVFK